LPGGSVEHYVAGFGETNYDGEMAGTALDVE
jgi:hypothetical protein